MRKIHSSTLDFPHVFYSVHTGELHVTQTFLKNSLYTLKTGTFLQISLAQNSTQPIHCRKLSLASASA